MNTLLKWFSTGRLKKILFWCVVAIIFFAIAGFFGVPPLLKSILVKQLSLALDRQVAIAKISFNPFTLKANIKGITIKEKNGKDVFFSLDELETGASFSIISGKIMLRRILLNKPYINIARNEGGKYNFTDILDKQAKKTPSAKKDEKSEPVSFALRDIKIIDGSVDFVDGPLKKKHTVRDFNLIVPFISNIPKHVHTDVVPSISLKINGTPYEIRGKTKPFAHSRETSFDINIDDINIPYYVDYIPEKIPYKITSGSLSTKIQLLFTQRDDKKSHLAVSGDVLLENLEASDTQNALSVKLPFLKITLDSTEPLVKKIHISNILVQSPEITLKRDKNKNPNKKTPAEKPENSRPEETSQKTDDQKTEPGGAVGDLQLIIDNIELSDGSLILNDRSMKDSARISLDKITLKSEKISLEETEKGKYNFSCVVNKKGSISADGEIGLKPLVLESKISVKNVDVRPFQPYFTEKINLTVTQGSVNTQGSLSVATNANTGLKAGFKGNASLVNIATIDKNSQEKIFEMDALSLRDIGFQYNPINIHIRGVALNDFKARIEIQEDGSLNLQQIAVKEKEAPGQQELKTASAESPADKKEEPVQVKIDALTLQNGTIVFKDSSVEPRFSSELSEIGGRISGLSSKPGTTADVELRGKYDRSAPLEIVGKINPLQKDLYVDLKAGFKNMDMSPATPYSGKYIGYTVEKGKLSFDMQYLIDKRKLDSKNNIFIDQLTLGDKVESQKATKLPVKLAIALLKDRRGQIKLDIPITGSLDDPQFSVWRIVIKVLLNLLAKAATSPFALIGSLFGGGEELGYVEFDYGRSVVGDTNTKKIETLGKVLLDKSELKVDIEGHVDLEQDKEGLKQYLVQKKVKNQKLKDTLKKKASEDIDIDSVHIEEGEYEKYLKAAYKAEKFPKPRNAIGFEKTIPVGEMEKLMLTNTIVKDEDLRVLAMRRASKVKEALLKNAELDPGRLFVVEPKSLSPEKKDKLKDSRVDFKLK